MDRVQVRDDQIGPNASEDTVDKKEGKSAYTE